MRGNESTKALLIHYAFKILPGREVCGPDRSDAIWINTDWRRSDDFDYFIGPISARGLKIDLIAHSSTHERSSQR